jgi:DNA-binding MarR family transcriptional regulator
MFPVLDTVLHAPTRLQLAVLLEAAGEGRTLTFPQLQALTGSSAGNLSTHLRKLEEVGDVAVTKDYDGRTPVTRVRSTAQGRERLATYRRDMASYLDGEVAATLLDTMATSEEVGS